MFLWEIAWSYTIYYTPEKFGVNEKFKKMPLKIYIPAINFYPACGKIPGCFREVVLENGKKDGKRPTFAAFGVDGPHKKRYDRKR